VDVATGEYEVHASVELGTPFGVVEATEKVSILVPAEEILEQRLAELTSEDPQVVRAALVDLRYFRSDGDKVAPALLSMLDHEDDMLRMVALSVLNAYPDHAKKHLDLFLEILADTEGRTTSERVQAAYLVARNAPAGEKYRAALEAAVENADDTYVVSYRSALRMYDRRHAPKEEPREGSR
jgi:hypothetical protein